MILLRRLLADGWKQLRDVELVFPPSGTVLIEGSNEAGKSSLFEAVFFALYGQGLTGVTLADLKGYGRDELRVELEFSVEDKLFSIVRRFGSRHTAKLVCPSENGESETITGVNEIRKRISDELRLTPEALLNTCFVEQKGLERLEDLSGEARRNAINELLNLRALTRLEGEFKIGREERDALKTQAERVQVARLDAQMTPLCEAIERAGQRRLWALWHEAGERAAQLRGQIANAVAREDDLLEARRRVGADASEAARLEALAASLRGDLSLRARAWREAELGLEAARSRVGELEALAQSLPKREAVVSDLQASLAELQNLEDIAAQGESLRVASAAARAKVERFDALQAERGDVAVKQAEVERERDGHEAALKEAEAIQRAHQDAQTRGQNLSRLLELLDSEATLARDAAGLDGRLNQAREQAERLPQEREHLRELNEWRELQQRQDETRRDTASRLARLEAERQLAQQAERERQAHESAVNAAKRARLDALQTRQEEADFRLQEAANRAAAASRTRAIGIAGLVLGALCAVAFTVLPFALMLAIPLLLGGGVLASRGGAAGRAARQIERDARREADALQGERRAIEGAGESSTEPQAMPSRLTEIEREIAWLQQAPDEPLTVPPSLLMPEEAGELGLEGAMAQSRARIASGEAAAGALDELETSRDERAQRLQDVRQRRRELAASLGLLVAPDDAAPEGLSAQVERERNHLQATGQAAADLGEAVSAARAALGRSERLLATLENEAARLQREQDELGLREGLLESAERAEFATQDNAAQASALAPARALLEAAGLPAHATALATHLALQSADLARDRQSTEALPQARESVASREAAEQAHAREVSEAWGALQLGDAPPDAETALSRLPALLEEVSREAAAFDAAHLREQAQALDSQLQAARHERALHTRELADAQARGAEFARDLEAGPEETPESFAHRRLELFASAAAGLAPSSNRLAVAGLEEGASPAPPFSPEDAERERDELRERLRHLKVSRRVRAEELGLGEEPLDLASEEAEHARAEREMAERRRAGEIVSRTRTAIVSRVMPLTMQNMRGLLPLLTDNRYADAQWDEEQNVISVHDARAGDFVRKRVFSGGARDQISLALRLSFALATLPGEAGIRPGWLFLDEPLSSFDRPRTRSLIELLTTGLIRQQFRQIFLVSHSESFDPELFDFRLRVEDGRIVDSTLQRI